MVIIKKKSEIDYDKLKELFAKRGHGILSEIFFDKCNNAFDGKDDSVTVFQCKCGEVFFLNTDLAKKAIEKTGSEDVPCKRCGKILEGILPGCNFIDFVKLHNFEKILDIVDKFEGNNFEKILDEINAVDSELVNATNPTELFYQIYILGIQLSYHDNSGSKIVMLIKELITKAKLNLKEFKLLLTNLVIGEDEKNTFLVTLQNGQHRFFYNQSKFFNLPSGDISQNMLDKMDTNSKLNEYNHFFEEKGSLDILLNLIRIAEGHGFLDSPFSVEKIVYKKKMAPVNYTRDKISVFANYPSGKPVNILLNSLLNNNLRNLHAHNDYLIDLKKKEIASPKFKISFEELNRLLIRLYELKLNLKSLLIGEYYRYFPVIRSIQLGYDEPRIKNGVLVPASPETLSELHIVGYGFRLDNVIHPKITLKKDRIQIESSIGIDYYDLNEWSKEWIRHIVKNNGGFTVSYVNILDFRQVDPLTSVKMDLTNPPLHFRSNNYSED